MALQTMLEGFRIMSRIRAAEEAIAEDFRQNKIFSFLHLSIGQEAIAAGACMALQPDDRVFGNHRSHGHYLAKGGNLDAMMAEVYGKAAGCCKGKGGSMHMLDRSVGFAGSTPILGSAVSIAAGSAFEQKHRPPSTIRKANPATMVFIGDGASEEGVFYETVNLAALWALPLIIVVENNQYAVNTSLSARRHRQYYLKSICAGMGCNHLTVDGNSFTDVYENIREIRETTERRGPTVIEATVFREMAHSGPIWDESVRTVDDKDARKARCPIAKIREVLVGLGVSGRDLDKIERGERHDAALALEKAKAADFPREEELATGVYAE